MRIERFEVEGFRNLTQPVVLEGLGPVNVIHGDNNVGKSNVLEAMALFFKILEIPSDPFREPLHLRDPDVVGEVEMFGGAEMFSLGRPTPITMSARLILTSKEMFDAGISPGALEGGIWDLGIVIKPNGRPIFGWDAFISQPINPRTMRGIRMGRFTLLNVFRQSDGDAPLSGRGLIPQELLLKLYDARDALESDVKDRMALFTDVMKGLSDILGPGVPFSRFDRPKNKADLVMDRQDGRLPVSLLGSGAQQLISLVARLVMMGSEFIAIEEPELNLRYTHQVRLQEIFRKITADPRGPSQIFITSHSPAFEVGDHFYAMTAGPDGPTIQRRPVSEAAAFTQQNVDTTAIGGRAPLCYVTSEGLVRLPPSVRKRLNVEHGGGVVFLDSADDAVEMMPNDAWLARIGQKDGEAPDESE